MNTQYRKNLKDVATACKNYTDKRFDDFKWELGANDFSVYNDTTSAYQKTAPSNTLAGKIKKINGNCVKYAPSTASDDTTALLKSIPTNTYTMNVDRVGGMSYKGDNLIDISLLEDNYSLGSTGVVETFYNRCVSDFIKIEPNATYNLIWSYGTHEVKAIYCFYGSDKTFISRTSGLNSPTTISASSTTYYIRVCFYTYDSGTTDLYDAKNELTSLYFGVPNPTHNFYGIRDSAVTSVVTEGENLLQISDVAETTTNGITYKVENGVITLNGTVTSNVTIPIDLVTPIPAGTYSFNSFNTKIVQFRSTSDYDSGTYIGNWQSFNAKTFTTQIYRLSLYFTNGTQVSNLVVKPMLVRGSTAPTEFKPYLSPITKTIPASIQALAGYGWGINDTCYNYIDFDNKKFVQKVARVDLGSLDDWIIRSGETNVFQNGTLKNVVKKPSSSSEVANALCDIYLNATTDNVLGHTPKTIAVFPSGYFGIFDTSYSTVEDFKTAMSGVYLYYELETPVETDISSYLTDFNPVTLNNNYASVSFKNTYDYDVPSKLSFYGIIYEVLCTSVVANGTTINLANNDAKYGWSAGTVRNVRDYDTNKGIKKVSVINSSNLSWDISARGFLYSTRIEEAKYGEDTQLTNVSCANYETLIYNYMKNNHVKGICMGDDKRIYIYDPDVSTNNVPVFNIYYELATPVEENITPISSQLLDVTSGDTITFTNTNNEAVSSEIVFLIEEEKSNE